MHPNEPTGAGTCSMQQQQDGSSWLCRVCGNINKEKRVRCNMTVCQAPRGFPGPFNEVAIGTPLPDSASMKWRCPVCQEMNRGRRLNCYRSECPGTRQQQQLQQQQQQQQQYTSPPTSAGTQGESDSSQHSSDIHPSKPSPAMNQQVQAPMVVKQETLVQKSPAPFSQYLPQGIAVTAGGTPLMVQEPNHHQPLFVSSSMQHQPQPFSVTPHGPFQNRCGDGGWANPAMVGMAPALNHNGGGLRIPSVCIGGAPRQMGGDDASMGQRPPHQQQPFTFQQQVHHQQR